jgi:hypothetical protein
MLAESFIALIVITGSAFLLGRWQRDVAFTNLMLVYGIVLSVVTIFSLHASVVHGSWNVPDLGHSDGEGYFVQAQLLAEEGILNFQTLIRSNYLGYQIFLAFLFTIFGTSVAVGVIVNNVLLLLTIVCLYRAALLLTGSKRAAMLACAAFMLTTANIFYSLVLLKEPALSLAFALVLLVLTKTLVEGRVGVGGAYIRLPFPVKIALFPIPTLLQSLLPFNFWSDRFLDEHFAFLLVQNFNIIWLLFVLPWFIFAVLNVRRVDRPLIGRLLLAGLAYYIIVAIIYGGLIPRYGTPAMIFVYPAIGYWWARVRAMPAERERSARLFVHYYAFFTLAALGYLGLQLMRG